MASDRWARVIAASIARHQTRGLVDDATGLADVVIHGRVNLLAVAEDIVAASARQLDPARRSWAGWFSHCVEDRRDLRRIERRRERLAEQIRSDPASPDAAIARLKLRDLES